jgi:hypothetical protein
MVNYPAYWVAMQKKLKELQHQPKDGLKRVVLAQAIIDTVRVVAEMAQQPKDG